MHIKCKCDNPEGNLCRACEAEVKEVSADKTADLWWPELMAKRSINSASGAAVPDDFLYV